MGKWKSRTRTETNANVNANATIDHVIVVSTCLFLRATLKAGLILILGRTGLKKLKQLQTGCYGFIDPRTPVQKLGRAIYEY